jgi:hypothetical protein
MKRVLLIIAGCLVILLASVGSLWLSLSGHGSSTLEKWIGSQVVAIINSYINPKVDFRDLDYTAPYTVTLDHLTFTDSNEQIVTIDRLRLELAEIPSQGKPILIQQIHMENPHFAFIQAGAEKGLIGWSHFVRSEAVKNPKSVPKDRRLSDVLAIRQLSIKNGEIVYDPRDGSERMTIPGITLQLETPPSKTEPGWYGLVGSFKKEPLLNVDIDGRINLDTALLELKKLTIRAMLDEPQYSTLPPAVQRFLRDHQVRGELEAHVAGQIPLQRPSEAAGTVEAELKHVKFAAYDFSASTRQRDASSEKMEARLDVASLSLQLPDQRMSVRAQGLAMSCGQKPMLSIEKIEAEIPRFPSEHEPLIFARLALDSPRLTLTPDKSEGLVGWSRFSQENDHASSAPASIQHGEAQSPHGGSEPVILQQMKIEKGAFTYGPPDSPMSLDGIDITMAMPPIEGQPGWYESSGSIRRAGILDASFRGRINIDESLLTLESFEAGVMLDESQYQRLPPGLQRYVRDHRVRGALRISGEGRFALSEFARSDARVRTRITGASLEFKDALWPIHAFDADVKIKDRMVRVNYDADALGGRAFGQGVIALNGADHFTVDWKIDNVLLEETLRITERAKPTRSGRISSTGQLSADVRSLPETLWGAGSLEITDASLMNFPIIRDLLAILDRPLGFKAAPKDKGSFQFSLTPTYVQLRDIKIISALVALTGGGRIYYDKRIEMLINAGVLERLEAALGEFGKLLASISDRAMAYQVRGTLSQPEITVKPLGL